MSIPTTSITFNDDGTAWWVLSEHDCLVEWDIPQWFDRRCVMCGGSRRVYPEHLRGGMVALDTVPGYDPRVPCICIDGRHTFDIEVECCASRMKCNDQTKPHCAWGDGMDADGIRTLRVSVVPGMVLPIVADVGPVLERRHIRVTGAGIAWLSEPIDGGGWKHTEITLPPDAADGKWAVKVTVAT